MYQTVCNEKVVLCLLYPHSPPYPNQHRPISRDRPAAGSFTQTGEPDMTTHMSNKRCGTLPLPKTTVRQTTTHDNRVPRPQREELLAPNKQSSRQSSLPTRPHTHPGCLAVPACPALPCLPASLSAWRIHPLITHHPPIIHPSTIPPRLQYMYPPPHKGGPADLLLQARA